MTAIFNFKKENMQKNWYVVYTKPKCEKKVAILLTRKKIEILLPLNCIKIQSFRSSKILKDPLFKSYVFVHVIGNEINLVKQTEGVISLLHWMGEPAVIKEDEITAIKEFTNDYKNIVLERTEVNTNDIAGRVDGPAYSMGGKVFTLTNKTVKVNLPSLGYIMVATMEDEGVFAREAIMLQNNSFSPS
jgi:transcription antitermination factor NusG